jgi:FAD/FMN-containing dehydrogenase
MHKYDNLITGVLFWLIIITAYFSLPTIISELSFGNENYIVLGLLLFTLAFISLLVYFLLVRKQRNIIHKELLSLKNEGITIFDRKFEKFIYSRDVADLPRIARLLINYNCLAIIQPKNIAQLNKSINLCERYQIPLIPRGAGTSGYGGVIPVRNGIIIDLTKWDRVITLDEKHNIVEVECGITWENLRNFLVSKGYTLLSYPSSAPASTVGGWVSQGGYGVGSSKYGSVKNSVKSIIVIGTDGNEFKFDDPRIFIGSSGTLGVIWKIKLKITPVTPLIHVALSSQSQRNILNSITEYQSIFPFYLRYNDIQNLIWKGANSEINFKSEDYKGGLILISFQEEDWDRSKVEGISNSYNLSLLQSEVADHFWKKRYYTLRMKRQGPSLIIAEVLVPTNCLENFVEKLSNRFLRNKYAVEIYSTKNEFSVVFVWFLEDIKRYALPLIGSLPYTFHWYRSFDVIRIARSLGGKPYSVGLWLSPYANILYIDKLTKMKSIKKEIDPQGIFNTYKVFGIRVPSFFPLFPWSLLVRIGVPIMSIVYTIIPKRFR